MKMNSRLTRRDVLRIGCAATAAATAARANPARPRAIPSHLPDRLAICYIGWEWITQALPDEPYGNMDQVLQQVRARGFNTVRAEMGLNWMFDRRGQRRGKMKFRGWVEGASSNLQCHAYTKGGGVHDVFERVMQLFELARKYDLFVITTSWEYQDALSHVADEKIRDEIVSVPYNDRLQLLAQQYARLLTALKKRQLEKRLALVEVINELNHPPIFCAPESTPPQTFADWTAAKSPPACEHARLRELAHSAVALLRKRHPDLLITVDLGSANDFTTIWPENSQVADHHVYQDGIVQGFWRMAGIGGIRPGGPMPSEAFIKQYLKPNPMSWQEIQRRGAHVRQNWLSIAWLYENLDNARFDEWCAEHYDEYRDRIRTSIDNKYDTAHKFASGRGLPLVVDEGGILYPPQKSKFVMTKQGREGEEMFINAAIRTGHWGVLPTGYTRPDNLTWHNEGQIDWLRGVNRRILESKANTTGA
jgi:hypothetical protein